MSTKRKKKRKYKIKNIISLIFIIIILIIFYNFFMNNRLLNNIKQGKVVVEDSYLNKIYKDELDDDIDSNLEKIIIEYMDKYFRTITTLKNIDMTNLFDDDAFEESYIHKTALSMLVDIRKLEKNDMRIIKAKYDIIYKKIKVDSDIITVTFLENDYLHFNFMKDIESKVYGVENIIEFRKKDDSYKILKIRKVEDFYLMITNKYETGQNNTKAKNELDKIKNDHINDYKKQLKDLDYKKKNYYNRKDIPSKKCDNKYDRKEALSYAKKYVINKNSRWANYSADGGNCQNYASQVIYAGGIPMDLNGDSILQWKHYGTQLDTSNQERGRSSSWTGVSNFYEYANNNEGFGLCSIVDINPFYAEAGDIGQVGYDGNYRHSVVVIGNIKNEDGNVVDLLINSNSIDLVNYPLSGYIYPYKRIIKIVGWNEK